ncbi:MAG: glycosyltransferase family 39 protein [Gemmatimonadales bacterium]
MALLLLGALLRLLSAGFSPGFLTVDDHHVLVEQASHLADGISLPPSYQRSFLYPWVVSLVMIAARAAGIASPTMEMLVIRLLQGAVSLLAIVLVFRILERRADRESAILGGLLVAALFVFPVTSVHQFEEVACQVPLLAGCWWLVRAENAEARAPALGLLAGLAIGTALILRFQLLSFVLPLLALCWYWRPRDVAPAATLGLLLVLAVQCPAIGGSTATGGSPCDITTARWWRRRMRWRRTPAAGRRGRPGGTC